MYVVKGAVTKKFNLRKDANWAIREKVFPLNKMAADVSKLPAAVFLIIGCEVQQ